MDKLLKFRAATVDVIQRNEALPIFERDLIIPFQQISRAAALHIRALLGGVKRALDIYRRVDETTTTEELWACTCRRCVDGSIDEPQFTKRGMEKC